jgi:hypothetical protein
MPGAIVLFFLSWSKAVPNILPIRQIEKTWSLPTSPTLGLYALAILREDWL